MPVVDCFGTAVGSSRNRMRGRCCKERGVEDHRHAVVQLGAEFVRFGRDDGETSAAPQSMRARTPDERDRGFADSPLEGNGFELSVPRCLATAQRGRLHAAVNDNSSRRRNSSIGLPRPATARMIPPRRRSIGPNSADGSKPLPISCGTGSSNPASSCGESATNRAAGAAKERRRGRGQRKAPWRKPPARGGSPGAIREPDGIGRRASACP
jgi:hypothetical protein